MPRTCSSADRVCFGRARPGAAVLALGLSILAIPGSRAAETITLAATGPVRILPGQPAMRSSVDPSLDRSQAPGQKPAQAAPGDRSEISVMVDRAKVIRLPEKAQTVVVGNPAIADIAIQKNGIVVVTGRSYGTTNLLALDGAGNMLAESTLKVEAPTDNLVMVQRGSDRQSYSCTPRCQPSVVLGDSTSYFSEAKAQADLRNAFATQR